MTNKEIIQYFGKTPVYKFDGSQHELYELQISNNNSYNFLIDNYSMYFVAQNPVEDSRVTEIFGE